MWRLVLAALSLMGLIASVLVALAALVSPGIFPAMPEGVSGRPIPSPGLMLLPGGFGLIALAMVFLMPSPWFEHRLGIFGMRRRRQNWALLAGSIVGGIAAIACAGALTARHVQDPVPVMREGRYELRQQFQTIRELSAQEYAVLHEAHRRQADVLKFLSEAVFCIFAYLSALLYALWYLQTEPQVNWRDGFWDELIR